MKHTNLVTLPDGRQLGYAEYGDPQGDVVLLFHGLPGSRLQRPTDESVAMRMGARVIAVDRPGFGYSSYQAGRTLRDWPRDIAALADQLGIERFAVAGISAGGVYALATAWGLPDRVSAVATASSPSPTMLPGVLQGMIRSNQIVIKVAQNTPPRLAPQVARLINGITRREPKLIAGVVFGLVSAPLTPEEQGYLNDPALQAMYIESVLDAYRNGWDGHAWDLIVLNRPWGFDLGQIRAPVHLWHGEADELVPPAMGRYLASHIPTCQATFIPGAGHLLIFAHWPSMLAAILRSHRRTPQVYANSSAFLTD
jgi:pimeloyl-ACP methyl ester carboxylesterase